MLLSQFPEAIAKSSLSLLDREKAVRKLQAIVDELYLSVDAAIAFNSDLKNDAQRKAKRQEMIADFSHLAEMEKLLEARRHELKEGQVYHEMLVNQWQAAKLLHRERIANLEAGRLE